MWGIIVDSKHCTSSVSNMYNDYFSMYIFWYGYVLEQAQPQHSQQVTESDTSGEDSVVMLDDYNSDLNLVIDENGSVFLLFGNHWRL